MSFFVEYIGNRYVLYKTENKEKVTESMQREKDMEGSASGTDEEIAAALEQVNHDCTTEDRLSVFVMEMGIIFHSIRKSPQHRPQIYKNTVLIFSF